MLFSNNNVNHSLKKEISKKYIIGNNYPKLISYLKKIEKRPVLSIILPVYNEENTIGDLLVSIPNNELVEVIVIDDHSHDDSLQVIEKIKETRNLEIVRHSMNMGYGGAITSGVYRAKGEIIVTMDSDGQHSPKDILSIIKPIIEGKADYVIGSRYLGRNYYDLPLKTRIGEAVIEKVIELLFGYRIMNNQNGFRAFHKSLVNIFEDTKFRGFTFATEIIIKAIMEGKRIEERPIRVYHREHGKSKIIIGRLTMNLFSCILLYTIKMFLRKMVKRK